MPTPSSDSAKVTFLDVPAAVRRVRSAAEQARASDPNIVAVVLFGSLATGGATPASDADVLVLLRHDSRRVLDRIPDYSRAFEGLGHDRFAREILDTGITVAGTIPL